jgi:hypothetical protein
MFCLYFFLFYRIMIFATLNSIIRIILYLLIIDNILWIQFHNVLILYFDRLYIRISGFIRIADVCLCIYLSWNRWVINTSLIFVTNRFSSFGRRFDEELRLISATNYSRALFDFSKMLYFVYFYPDHQNIKYKSLIRILLCFVIQIF